MTKKIQGKLWYCCPKCGKKLFPLQPGAVCRGVMTTCRGRFPDGTPCRWSGEIVVDDMEALDYGEYTKDRGQDRRIL